MVVADIVRLRGDYDLVGFLDDVNAGRAGVEFCDSRVLGGREQLDRLRDAGVRSLALGFGNSPARLAAAALVRAMGYELVTALHPAAVVGTQVRIGAGTVIKAGAVIDPGVTIGECAIVGSCVCVGHGSILDDGVRVAAGASLPGSVSVGRASIVGAGVVVRDRIRIGSHSLIGAGSVVVNDIPDGVVAWGNPARVRRAMTPDDD
jgi:acetyltransferase EpsM